MSGFIEQIKSNKAATCTVAETLFYLADPAKRIELENFRVAYESHYGPTDLTRRYTSTWPKKDQEMLRKADIRLYFSGFPPFAKEFLVRALNSRLKTGKLDDTPDDILEFFLTGEMGFGDGRERN